MREVEKTITRVEYLESADGEYRIYIGGADKDSERYQEAKKQISDYEESALGAMANIVMSMKHKKLSCDDIEAAQLLCDCSRCCDDAIYLFKVDTQEQLEALVKWMYLKHRGEEISVALPEPVYKTRTETVDGKLVEVKNDYLSLYYRESKPPVDPERFIGHVVVVLDVCDYQCYLEGTIEEVYRRNEVIRNRIEERILSQLK